MSSPATINMGVQTTLDDLGTPLSSVTFCVVDLETTGGSPADLGITEIGAVKTHAGLCVGEFQTLVNPAAPIPAFISVLTGITDATVADAPRIAAALPAFLEFSRGCVLVAHNAPYDMSYLRAAAEHLGYPWEPLAVLDTARLSRNVLARKEVPNHKLATLARHFHATTVPNHRALDDARATVDVLHGLFERIGSLGVTSLEETLSYTSRVSEAQRRKRHLADHLPAAPGVYIFSDAQGESLYVGTSRNIRTRVRTYFTASEQRTRMAEMVGLATRVTPIVCATPLEAAVRELRLIAERNPRYNRRSRHPERRKWLKLTAEAAPRLSIVATPAQDEAKGAHYLGPLASRTAAALASTLQAATGLRSCSERLSPQRPRQPCSQADLGRCAAPCAGPDHYPTYQEAVQKATAVFSGHTTEFTDAVLGRIQTLAAGEHYEQAGAWLADLRTALHTIDRVQQRRALSAAGTLVAAAQRAGGWDIHVVKFGRLAGALHCPAHGDPRAACAAALAAAEHVAEPQSPHTAALSAETDLLIAWLAEDAVHLVDVDDAWALPLHSAAADLLRVRSPSGGSTDSSH